MGFTSYSGPASKFPAMSEWKSLDDIYNANKSAMLQMKDTESDVEHIKSAVQSVGKSVGVDDRALLCMIVQESTGDVGVKTTYDQDGKGTGGLMQCEGSPHFDGKHGLSQADITSMVEAGAKHFKQNLQDQGNSNTAECYYQAFREYNSGQVDKTNLSNGLGATASYVSDLANRLLGRTD